MNTNHPAFREITKTEYNKEQITCPNCGYMFTDSWEYDDCGEIDCEECETTFDYERYTKCSYTSWISEE